MTYESFNKTFIEKISLYETPTPEIIKAYILGALHDASEREYTYRLAQKSEKYVEFISQIIHFIGFKAWYYKEGKTRNVHIVEFSKKILKDFVLTSVSEHIAYVRGYFDSEGSVPRYFKARYYLYFAQKDLADITNLRDIILNLGLKCGVLHNPSYVKDPNYFRFYLIGDSKYHFTNLVGSWHVEKAKFLRKEDIVSTISNNGLLRTR
ncbi:hypothetical protein HYV31_03375 [candidate division WWE3 bacterium]|nr:hypothetical protein [candidate division WWE3 bacterium]